MSLSLIHLYISSPYEILIAITAPYLAAGESLTGFLGRLHPIIVHFPIALILCALLAESLRAVTKRPGFNHAARFCLFCGIAGALAAALLGWFASKEAHYSGDLAIVLHRHMWCGFLVAFLSVVTGGLKILHQKFEGSWYAAYIICLCLTALTVAYAGHLGGTLIYGKDYFTW